MTLAVPWLLFPLVLGLICLGCGLLAEELLRRRLPVLLLFPLGFAVVIVIVQLATISDATAEVGIPAAIAAAAAGFGLSYPWGRIDPFAVLAPLLAFAAYAAPVVLSGDATFTGYIKLDDTATWFALTDRVMEHGRSIEGLAPSSYEATLAFNLADGYPVGAFLPLGVGRAIVGQDVAWVFQPYLAFVAALLAASLYVVAGTVLRPGPMRMLAAAVGAQPALLFGYVLWGGIKEVVAAALLALLGALVAIVLEDESGPGDGDLVLIGVVGAAMLAVLSASGGVWVLGVLVPAAAIVVRRHGPGLALRAGGVILLCTGALSAPLIAAGGFVPPTSSPVTSDTAKGNLAEPLDPVQLFGVWPVGDFRFEPQELGLTYVLIALVAAAAAAAVVFAWRRRAPGLPVFTVGTATACVAVLVVGSPWVDAKALATASPAVVLAAVAGVGMIAASASRIAAAVAVAGAVALCAGVVWSNVLAYHEATLAPRDRHAELERIGEQIAGQGPTLMTEYEPYGVRHFLRKADPEGASELRRRVVPLRSGAPLRKLATADIDEFQLEGLRAYRTLVLRRSPIASRPPSVYRLLSRGRFYDVWQLDRALQDSLLEHDPLGSRGDPAARPSCARMRALGRRAAAAGGRLAVSRVPPAVRMNLAPPPPESGGDAEAVPRARGVVLPGERADFADTLAVRAPGLHQAFVGGAFRREVELRVDDRRVSRERHRLSHTGHYEPLGHVYLPSGSHRVQLAYRQDALAPGDGGRPFPLGPIYLARPSDPRVELVPAARAGSLCRQRLDWVESVTR